MSKCCHWCVLHILLQLSMVQLHHLEAVLLLPICTESALKVRTHNEGVIA